MSYRLINANALAANCKQVNDMPCIYADLPNGLDGGYYDLARAERTCELVETDRYTNSRETIHVLECSECGETCEHVNGIYPRCPHCGAKVVGE